MTLVRGPGGAFVSIPYPYAGLWALLAEGACPGARANELMGLLTGADEKSSERNVARTLEDWRRTGLIVAE